MTKLPIQKSIYILLSLIICQLSIAQEYVPYTWEESRTLTKLTKEEASLPLYQIYKAEVNQYVYDPQLNNNLVCYVTSHEILRVNNDEALNQKNQIYIPMYNTIELVDIHARAITPNGQVINLDKSNIKELEDDESGYKIFAIEGAEVGGEIEYFYTRKTYNSNFFTQFFQFSYPVKSYYFSLKCPENLEYAFKVYNHDSTVIQTDTTESFNLYEFSASDIIDLQSEDFGAYDNERMRLEGKLAYNSVKGKGRLFTWGDAGQAIYDQLNTLNKAEKKAFYKFVKGLDLSGNPIDAFKKAEHHIKTNYFLEEEAGDFATQLNFILKNKFATSRGFTKLYLALLNYLEIRYEVVITCDRNERAFDPDFDSWNYLDEYLIYLNDADLFMSPKDVAFRVGTIPSEYIGAYGLFIRPEKVQNFIYPVAHVGYIPAPSYQDNYDNMDIAVSFTEALDQNTVKLERSYKGYSAEYYKAALSFLNEEQTGEMLEDVIKFLSAEASVEDVTIKEANANYENWKLPFTVKGTFTTPGYIESAGDVILFKAGELIGPQSELYQERDRKTDVVNDFNRGYLRKISVQIPEGYSIQNADDLIIKEQVFEEERLIYNFVSDYTINGQLLEIQIDEFYDELYYPLEKFEPFRKVINAAADWNKIVLVLKEN
ncbi:DUF3857 domain-containing protein [Marinoscillum sp. MHG1-6]|uniref:DUF3857 domain-containing protein n=1 Tax=Marinoscillum sp. MHG1-6 TaxID=2959627 RepID=UPI00215807C5|nr:DUF3857 domain-containing protein [Marinoscillum sp. MHG1-6]